MRRRVSLVLSVLFLGACNHTTAAPSGPTSFEYACSGTETIPAADPWVHVTGIEFDDFGSYGFFNDASGCFVRFLTVGNDRSLVEQSCPPVASITGGNLTWIAPSGILSVRAHYGNGEGEAYDLTCAFVEDVVDTNNGNAPGKRYACDGMEARTFTVSVPYAGLGIDYSSQTFSGRFHDQRGNALAFEDGVLLMDSAAQVSTGSVTGGLGSGESPIPVTVSVEALGGDVFVYELSCAITAEH